LFLLPTPPRPTLFPYTTLFRSRRSLVSTTRLWQALNLLKSHHGFETLRDSRDSRDFPLTLYLLSLSLSSAKMLNAKRKEKRGDEDRKSTRLNSSHVEISYAVFC